MAVQRTSLEPCTKGYPKTYTIRIRKGDGQLLNFDDVADPVAKAVKPDGTTYVTPTAAKKSPQAEYEGQMTVLFADTDLDTTGTWKLDIYIGDTTGNEEPITRRYQFVCEPTETEA